MRSFAWYSKFLHGCILVSHGVRNLAQGAKFLSLIPTLYPAAIEAPLDFICYVKILHSHAKLLVARFLLWLSFLHTWLAWQRAMKLQILHVIELQLALPWTTQSAPSFLACFNDKKATKNTKTCQKLISNKGPYVPIELKGINYYSKVFKTVNFKL